MEENVNQTEKEMAENEKQNQTGKEVAENANLEQTETIRGLTAQQVEERKEKGLWNKKAESATKTTKEIVKSNVFTYFNLIFLVIWVIVNRRWCFPGSDISSNHCCKYADRNRAGDPLEKGSG